MTDTPKYTPPTTHQLALARVLRKIADSLDAGEIGATQVGVHYGTITVINDRELGGLTYTKHTEKRAVSIILRYNIDPSLPLQAMRDILSDARMS